MKKSNILDTPKILQKDSPLIDEQTLNQLKSAADVTLAVLGVLGIATVALVAPNLLSAIGSFHRMKRKSSLNDKGRALRTARTFYYLKNRGYISFKGEPGRLMVFLTRKGKNKLKSLNIDLVKIPKPDTWNHKWWLIAADIPTKDHRLGADLLRKKLKDVGFYPLQRTLWIYPHDPRAEIEFIAKTFRVQHFLTVMEINRLDKEDEKKIVKFFKKLKLI